MGTLYLFDIDGTLVDVTNLHVSAYQQAYADVVRKSVDRTVFVARFGKPERALHEEIFALLKLRDEDRIDRITHRYADDLAKSLKVAQVRPLPGVSEFLDAIEAEGSRPGIVTGNIRATARAILKQAGLLGRFKILSCAEAGMSRADIVRRALSQAADVPFERAVVIGDTEWDIQAGKECRTLTVAVRTGCFPDGLDSADLVLDDLTQYPFVFDLVRREKAPAWASRAPVRRQRAPAAGLPKTN